MKQVYVCNVCPEQPGEQQPLGLPTMNFDDVAPVSPPQHVPHIGEGISPSKGEEAEYEQPPLGLPKMEFGKE